MTPEQTAAVKRIRAWKEDPVLFVRECLGVEPDAWQAKELRAFPSTQRMAEKACKGPGKSALLAWLAWNFMATRPHPKIACMSISATNLADNLWTELAKWQQRSPYLKQTFTWTKTRIFCNDHPETWWASARAWSQAADSQQQADTLAGLHADYVLILMDEVGGYPDSVLVAAEAALSTGKECKIVMAGNPTHLSGPLYRASTVDRAMWHVNEITGDPDDPNRSPRISIQWAREQIAKWGRDNPWVMVNVFGQFPPSSLNSLLGVEDVNRAMQRHYKITDYNFAAKVIGVDVARQGDDATVMFPRQGLVAFPPVMLRNADSQQISGRLAQAEDRFRADATFVDATGGWGWGAIDAHRLLGRDPQPVQFSGKPIKSSYFNKRTEMWMEMADWVKAGGALPNLPDLVAELTTPTYCFKGDKILLEDKEQIKERLGRSPDYADALALTFAASVMPRPDSTIPGQDHRPGLLHEYDPFTPA